MIFYLLISVNAQIFKYQSHVIPHPDKVHKGGEDAFYASSTLIAVADGVGGWNNQGVDPSLYSKTLCNNIEKNNHINDPKELLTLAEKITKHIEGSSTLVLMRLLSNYTLNVANIGDCAYTIIRNNEILHQSTEQQHSFNYPFQIGSIGDDPKDAQEFSHDLQVGDIVIIGSDGLYDNLDEKQILKIYQKHGLHEIALRLAKQAFKLSLNHKYDSPFAKRAKLSGRKFLGGKSDDITVVVAEIQAKQDDL